MKYRMYVDEVGNSDMGNTDNPNHRFLSLTGVIMALDYVKEVFSPKLEKLKNEYFTSNHPDDPVILHRKEIVNAKHPFEVLSDPKIRNLFDDNLINMIKETDFTLITVVIDKKEHNDRYSTWKYDPYHYCMAILLERYVMLLERKGIVGDVMAESRGGKEDRRLKDSFSRLHSEGTNYISAVQLQKRLTSKQLKVKKKAVNVPGLQLADLVAHPSRREILEEKSLIVKEAGKLLGDRIISVLKEKYDSNNGTIYGKKVLP